MNNNNELFKAGTYYVGDLCYIFDGSDWDALLEKNKFFEIPAVDFKENKVGGFMTANGDGEYTSNIGGHTFPVDSGTIGICPIELVDVEEVVKKKFGAIITFHKDFEISYETEEKGQMKFGHITIDTIEIEEEEEEWYNEDEEEEY